MKRGFTLVEVLIVVGAAVLLAAIILPLFAPARDGNVRRSPCQSNLKNIGLGFQQYLQDNDEVFPSNAAGSEAFGWVGQLQPYIKSTQVLQCPSEGYDANATDPRATGYTNYTDYWYNSRLAKRNQSELSSSALTVINGDGNDGSDITDARYALSSIPLHWKNNTSSPLHRHVDGMNFGFTDGHVKWFKADVIEAMDASASPKSSSMTFALK